MHKSLSVGQAMRLLGAGGLKGFGSSVAVHKLRESKWFGSEETRLLCAVMESGFIVEMRGPHVPDVHNDRKVDPDTWFGIALWKSRKEKSPLPEHLQIYTLSANQRAVRKLTLAEIWSQGLTMRINNFDDKDNKVHSEKDIRQQIKHAKHTMCMVWHNTKHFAYWCRYGERPKDIRRKQMSETVMWGSVGMNAGLILLNRNRNHPRMTI